AKYFGAEVTGVCSTTNVELVKSLGADSVIDYTSTSYTAGNERYDIVFDTVGKSSFFHCKRVLKQGGIYLTTAPYLSIIPQMIWTSRFGSKKAVLWFAGLNFRREALYLLTSLVEAGTIQSINDRCYPLEQII